MGEARRKAALLDLSDFALAKHLGDAGSITPWQALCLLAGRTSFFLGPYCILEKLGSGGAAVIYKARHARQGNVVALKVISAGASEHPAARARFRRELRAAVAIQHPHVVATYGGQCVDNVRFLVMEYVDGEDLDQWSKRYPLLPIAWCCEAVAQAALGLEHIHRQGVVHRDIKPNNLLVIGRSLQEVPTVKIADLGVACSTQALNDGLTPLTAMHQFLGTPNFVSPEQVLNTRSVDHRADIFSLGCTLFKLVTHHAPWEGASIAETLLVRTRQDAPPASRFRKEVPGKLDRIIARMLARDPACRFERAQDVAEALAPFRLSTQQAGCSWGGAAPAAPEISPPHGKHASAKGPGRQAEAAEPCQSAASWRIECCDAKGVKKSYSLAENQSLVVGRAADCDIHVRDLQASRRHCALTHWRSKWFVDDLGSNNGTVLNGIAVQHAELKHGDQLQLGASTLTLIAPPRPIPLEASETIHLTRVDDVNTLQFKPWEPKTLIAKLAAAARRNSSHTC